MIPKETIDKIFESVKIEEVIEDFIRLQKKELIILASVLFIMKKHLLLQSLQLKEFISVLVVGKGECCKVYYGT